MGRLSPEAANSIRQQLTSCQLDIYARKLFLTLFSPCEVRTIKSKIGIKKSFLRIYQSYMSGYPLFRVALRQQAP
jgi:hypothetical protein